MFAVDKEATMARLLCFDNMSTYDIVGCDRHALERGGETRMDEK